jgi:CHAT domain-containing protein/Tfp pilus assembly protein PilF
VGRVLKLAAVCLALLVAGFAAHADDRPAKKAELSKLARDARYPEAMAIAKELADKAVAEGKRDSRDYAEAISWMGFLHQVQGEITASGKLFREAVDIYSKILPADDPDLATSLNNLGFYYCQIGDYPQSEALYVRSLDIRERMLPKNDPAIADSLNNLAELFKSEERWDEVVPLLNRALEIRTRSLPPNHPIIAGTLQNLAGALEVDPTGGSFIEAQKLLEKALEIRRSSQRPDHPEIAGTLSKLATNLFNQGKYRQAEQRFREALALRRASQPPHHPDIASTLVGLALNQIEQGKPEEAEQLLRETLSIRQDVFAPTAEQFAESYRYLGRALLHEGKTQEALEAIRKGTAVILARSQRREKAVEHLTEHLQILAAADATANADHKLDFDEGFTIGQNAEQSETAQAVSGMAARFATQDEKLQKLVGDLQAIEATQAVLERHLTDDLAKPPEEREPNIRKQLDAFEIKRAQINAEVKAAFPEYFDLVNASSVPSAEALKLMKDDEALITIVSGADHTYVWALTKEGFAWNETQVSKIWLENTIKKLRGTLDTEDLKRNITATSGLFDLGLSYELYEKLLAPLESVFASKQKLIIVPSGPLTSLPFQVLVTKQPKISHPVLGDLALYRDVAWIIREHALTVLPSVTSLKALRTLPQRAENRRPMIGFGNPKFGELKDQSVTRGGPARLANSKTRGAWSSTVEKVMSILASLPELPGAEQELKTVAKDLGASDTDLHIGTEATEAAVKHTDLTKFAVVYFATHGLVADDVAGLTEPALVLTPPTDPTDDDDGLLTASEVSALNLNADWVVLAACNTAAESKPGARALLVSHWRVDSEAAATLTTSTFGIRAKNPGIGRAEALREAMLQQITKTPATPAQLWDAYPAFWAPFSVVGEGS